MDDKLTKIRKAKDEIESGKTQAQERLKSAQKDLPGLLAGRILGEVTEGELETVKQEIADLEAYLHDAPLLLEGLAAREIAVEKDLRKAKKAEDRAKAEERYLELKARIDSGEDYSRGLDGEFRSVAHEVGKKAEAHELVEAWKNRLSLTPLGQL